jgi:hypothetical protein
MNDDDDNNHEQNPNKTSPWPNTGEGASDMGNKPPEPPAPITPPEPVSYSPPPVPGPKSPPRPKKDRPVG